MLYYFIALSAAAIVLLAVNPRSGVNRWAAFFLFSAGIGGLAYTIRDSVLPGYPEGWLLRLEQWLEIANHTLAPYGVVMFAVAYSGLFGGGARKLLTYALLLPVVATFLLTPTGPALRLDFAALLLWVGPYYLFACALLFYSWRNETDRDKRKSRFITFILIAPTLLAILVFINIARAFDPSFPFFGYVSVFIGYSLIAGVLFSFANSVLGLRVRLEREQLDSTMKAISSGTAMLNHTIKNEIGKIAISTDNLQAALTDAPPQVKENLRIIARAADHMQAMVERIHLQAQHIVLRETDNELSALIRECVERLRPLIEERGIIVTIGGEREIALRCDKVHVLEVLNNVLVNAIEALHPGGRVEIRLSRRRKYAEAVIRDNGPGIPKDRLGRVFEPFYSSKGNSGNFGLGLSYCYNVMAKSGGSIDIDSRPGEGTTVTLLFPYHTGTNSRKSGGKR